MEINMQVRELIKHFPARAPEWMNAVTMLAWGAYIVLHPEVFDQPYFRVLADMAWTYPPAGFWGLLTIFVGFTRIAALYINGTYSRTPLIRLAASLVSAFVWSQIVIGLWLLPEGSPGIIMYGSAVCVDLISAYRASKDVGMVERDRRELRGARGGSTGADKRVATA